jgi:hypothetical protein
LGFGLWRAGKEELMRSDMVLYWKRLEAFVRAREVSGGELDEAEESERVASLDEVWQRMTAEEREIVERSLSLVAGCYKDGR